MSLYFKHIESIRLPNKVSAPFPCQISENGQISIVTSNCVLILHPYLSKDNTSPSISMKKLCIQPSNFALSSNVDVDVNSFIKHLPKTDMFEAVLQTELSAHLECGTSVESRIIKAAWSPSRLVDDYDCAIATLSNTNSLEICIKTYDNSYYEEYLCVCNITQKYIEINKPSWKDVSKSAPLKQFGELKARVEKIRPTAFAWSHIINQESKFCILIVGHHSGTITFWKVNTLKSSNLTSVNIILLAETTVTLKHITVILWKEAGSKALLFIGNIEGKATVLPVSNISDNGIEFDQELDLWPEGDLIRVEHLTLLVYQNFIFVFLVKGSDLIVYLINNVGANIDTCVFHIGNVVITGVQQVGINKILVATLPGAIKELKLSCINQKINIEWRHIYININWYVKQCLGFITSKNGIFFGFLIGPCKTANTKDDKVQNELVVFSNTEKDALEVLLSNPSKSFQDYWDCLEIFRVNCLLDKQFPCEKFNSEAKYDELSFYSLKLHLWASKIFETVCEVTTNVSSYMKPHEDLLQILNLRMVIFRMNFLLKLNASGTSLSTFQLQNLFVLNNYLKRVVLEDLIPKLELGDKIVADILEVMAVANELAHPRPPTCRTCGEDITDLSCFPPHFDMRCVISHMQIGEYPCYRCLFCKCLAHEDVEKEVPVVLCPFCEVPMSKTRIDIVANAVKEFRTKKFGEFCKSNCVTSVLKVSGVEEHAFVNESKMQK